LRFVLAAIASGLAAACVIAAASPWIARGLLPSAWTAAQHAEDRNVAVSIAAREAVQAFLDVDYRHVDTDIDAVLADATGRFARQFSGARGQYAALTRTGQVVSVGRIREVGITRADDRVAVLSLAADSEVANSATRAAAGAGSSGAQLRTYSFRVTMKRVGGRWLMSDLEVIT
jgi:hypothetical protein